jgi:hypothetical protein
VFRNAQALPNYGLVFGVAGTSMIIQQLLLSNPPVN